MVAYQGEGWVVIGKVDLDHQVKVANIIVTAGGGVRPHHHLTFVLHRKLHHIQQSSGQHNTAQRRSHCHAAPNFQVQAGCNAKLRYRQAALDASRGGTEMVVWQLFCSDNLNQGIFGMFMIARLQQIETAVMLTFA